MAHPPPSQPTPSLAGALHGVTVLERGWLSSNNVVLHGGGQGAVLIDSSHALHGAQTVALLGQTLGSEPLVQLVNTHLHSDHCGGNATVQQAWGCRITVPPGQFGAARSWNEDQLSYCATGQICQRFVPDDCIQPGQTLEVGSRSWEVLAAPGHDPHSIMLFDAEQGVLISADALWENGFGVVFPELEGEQAFDDVAQVLDLIESLDARWVIPGHGSAFEDLPGALQRARRRLSSFVADPTRHAWHGVRVMVKYHLLEQQRQSWPDFNRWFESAPLCTVIWHRLGQPTATLAGFGQRTVRDLVRSGALAERDGFIVNV